MKHTVMEKKHEKNEYAGYWIRRFLCSYLTDVRNLSANTVKAYRDAIKMLIAHVCKSRRMEADTILVTDLTPKAILSMLDDVERKRGCSVKTRNLRLVCICRAGKVRGGKQPRVHRLGQGDQEHPL